VTLLPETVTPAAEGVDFLEKMYSALMATPVHTAWVVSTGTLTNIGLLFMRYPDLAEHIKGLSIMGGAIGGGFSDAPMGTVKGEGERFGNWTPFAEFNVRTRSSILKCNADCLELARRPSEMGYSLNANANHLNPQIYVSPLLPQTP
jgi:uridine nucleosidase